jgi:small subunit ribosomal protein S18
MAMAANTQRRPFFRRRKTCPFTGTNAPKIDYKDAKLLVRYVSERGKIVHTRERTTLARSRKFIRLREFARGRWLKRTATIRF